MPNIKFVRFEAGVDWIIHGDSVPTLEPIEFRPPSEGSRYNAKAACFEPTNSFDPVDDLDELEGYDGRRPLAEELLLDGVASGRVRMLGLRTNLADTDYDRLQVVTGDFELIPGAFVLESSLTHSDSMPVLDNEVMMFKELYVSLEDLLAAFRYRPSVWRDEHESQGEGQSAPSVINDPGETGTPPQNGFAAHNIKMTAAKISECKNWIKEQAATGKKAFSKAQARQLAKAAIPGLSGRGFDTAWEAVAPVHWRMPGRKSNR